MQKNTDIPENDNSVEVRFYEQEYFIVLCFASIILSPVGVYLILRFRKNYSFRAKICMVLVSFLCLTFLSFGFYTVIGENLYLKSCISTMQNTISSGKDASKLSDGIITDLMVNDLQNDKNKQEPNAEENLNKNSNKLESKNSKEQSKEESIEKKPGKKDTEDKNMVSNFENGANKSSNKNKISESENSNSKSKNMNKSESKLNEENVKIVYVTKNGKKYHYKNPCGKGDFTAIKIEDAIEKGYEPCKKCVKK